MLTGDFPFRGSVHVLMHQIVHDDGPPHRRLNGHVPRDLETICLKCLEKSARNRYQSAMELSDQLRQFLRGEPIQVRAITRIGRMWRWCQRYPAAAAVVALLVLIAVVDPLVALNRASKVADHDHFGVNFRLLHWLIVDGNKDYEARLRESGEKLFVVTINGAQVGGEPIPDLPPRLTPEVMAKLTQLVPKLIQPLDQGSFDNRQLMGTLREIGFRGPIGLQCFGIPGDARDHLQRSMIVWRSWQAEWAKESP